MPRVFAAAGAIRGPTPRSIQTLVKTGILSLVWLEVGLVAAVRGPQPATMVAALWGIFAWKEFAGANRRAQAFLALMFIFYALAILLIARANTAS